LSYANLQHWLTANVRATYRGRFGYNDITGDNILNDDREYIKGFVLLNATVGIAVHKGLQFQLGMENMLNHMDKDRMPNLSGRVYFINCNMNLSKLFSTIKNEKNNEKNNF
jgi:outer membrane receptor for ferrienterochelin and colicins